MRLFPCFCFARTRVRYGNGSHGMVRAAAVILLLAHLAFLPSCGPGKEESASQDRHQQEVQKIRQALIARYNPVVFPAHLFSKRKVITYNLQKMLISKDRRPILFEGYLEDITKEGERFEIHFSSSFAYGPTVSLLDKRRVTFHLRCDYESIRSVLENPPELEESFNGSALGDKDFFVVCQVWSVRKIVNYSAEGYGPGEEETGVETPDLFSVHGKLLELVEYPRLKD